MGGLREAFERVGLGAEHQLPHAHAPGLALGVTDREDVLGVVVRGFADVAAGTPVRPETRFQIGSISKSFTAVAVLQLVDEGLLDLRRSVNDIVPWLGLPEPFGPITLHHLMTHTAGLGTGTEDAPTGPGALDRLRTLPPTTAPGERFWYSNDGWKVVGACLEEVTGRRTDEVLAERVLGPLGMTSSTAAITDDVRLDLAVGYEPMYQDRPIQLRHPLVPATWLVTNTADGSIVSDVVEMCAYARLLLNRGALPDGSRLLSEARFDELVEPRVDEGDGGRYGYGLWTREVDGHRWVGHSGGMVGYTALLATSPDEGLAGIVLQNGSGYRWELMRTAIATVRAALAGAKLPTVWTPSAATTIPNAADFVGSYRADDGDTLEVSVDGDGLAATFGSTTVRLERDPLDPDPTDRFLVPDEGLERFELAFRRDDAGAVVEASHGPTWFRGERFAGPEPEPAPAAWSRLVGLYRNDDPWSPVLRIYARKGRLVLQWPAAAGDEEAEGELVPLADGWFAVGEERDPRRIRFLGEGAGGLAVVAEFNGGSWFRSFET